MFKRSIISKFNDYSPCHQFKEDCPKICSCAKRIESHVLKYNVSDYKDKVGIYGAYIYYYEVFLTVFLTVGICSIHVNVHL